LGSEGKSQTVLDEAQASLAATNETIATHALTMRTQGVRLLQLTTGSMSQHRDHWVTEARQMVADGSRLETTARMIDSQARLLGQHPGQAVRSDLRFVHDTGTALVAEGDELVTHGQAIASTDSRWRRSRGRARRTSLRKTSRSCAMMLIGSSTPVFELALSGQRSNGWATSSCEAWVASDACWTAVGSRASASHMRCCSATCALIFTETAERREYSINVAAPLR
jgi:hypothetical protein